MFRRQCLFFQWMTGIVGIECDLLQFEAQGHINPRLRPTDTDPRWGAETEGTR